MAVKRALIVDDSRSARVILGRMLETHGLQVDTVESGEQALEYLNDVLPDVVFMDHLMPGMDGFATVKTIKSDARTAVIPIMMYTSQEGEAYLREARSVGAIGVLPKTLLPIDVSRALYQLHLLPERRDTTPMPLAAMSQQPFPHSFAQGSAPSTTDDESGADKIPPLSTRDQFAELRRSLEQNLEHAARRISNELRSTMQTPQPSEATAMPRAATPRGLIAALLIFALVPTIVSGVLLWRAFSSGKAQLDQANARLGIVVAEQQTQIEALRTELRKQTSGETNDPTSTRTDVIPIVYGEPPLAGARIDSLRKQVDRLQAEGFKGTVRIESFTGDFCLVRGGAGHTLASAELPQRRCELIGNPFDDALTTTQRQTSEYAALVTAVSQATRGTIQIATVYGGRKPIVAYPPQSDSLTAGEWNGAAARNHRIEITAAPAQSKQNE